MSLLPPRVTRRKPHLLSLSDLDLLFFLSLPHYSASQDDESYGGSSSSQRNKRPAPSQSSGSQKRAMREDDSDQGSDIHVPASKQPATTSVRGIAAVSEIPADDMERLIKDVVRLAIFTAHSESPLKREDIKDGKREKKRERECGKLWSVAKGSNRIRVV